MRKKKITSLLTDIFKLHDLCVSVRAHSEYNGNFEEISSSWQGVQVASLGLESESLLNIMIWQ